MIMSRYDKSADARVGGVFGRYPPEVQYIDILLMYNNTNHDGPRISAGTPQGNPHVRSHEMLSELKSTKHHSRDFVSHGIPSQNPKLPLLGLLTILLIRLALDLSPRPCLQDNSPPVGNAWGNTAESAAFDLRAARTPRTSKNIPQAPAAQEETTHACFSCFSCWPCFMPLRLLLAAGQS